jgi:regulator of protease activity HflC (stomatin/prohibitin superfamily)
MGMSGLVIAALAFVILVLILKGVRIVPQAENWVVERFGKYVSTLNPGLNLINPLFSRVAQKVDIRECVLDLPKQGIITRDNASLSVDGIVYFKIMDPYKSYYGISNLRWAIQNIAQTTLRSIMGRMTLDESLSSREKINAELLTVLDEASDAWGTKITRVEIREIQPPEDIITAMTLQMKAEREKRARILEAEAKLEAARREAEARERLAQAEANAIAMVADSLKATHGDPLVYLLGQEYVKGITRISESNNGKIVVLPADILDTLKTMFSSKAK